MKSNVSIIIQARSNSVRFPSKVLKKINNITIIEIIIRRLKKCKYVKKIVVATSNSKKNKKFINFLKQKKINFFIGSDQNVLERFYLCAKKIKASTIVRITGDSPLIDPELVDQMIKKFKNNKVDYLSNTNPMTYPDGQDIEIFKFKTIADEIKKTKNKYDLEHVTPFIINNPIYLKKNVKNNKNYSFIRWSVDHKIDYDLVKVIFDHFYPNIFFSWKDALKLVLKNKKKYTTNGHILRNEGAKMSKTKKLWIRAKEIIPGGNMLLSKRPELFHPKLWPAYYKKAKGCFIWDLDGKKYIDVSLMGVGSNLLGYANSKIDSAVKKAVLNGSISSLNCYEEVQLIEKLLELHPWADMGRLGRTGGETSAMAVRIARAATGKDKIAFCGYHGWHDWYLSANIKTTDGLKPHLMPGLDPSGVPKALRDTSIPFNYNKIDELYKIVSEHDLAAVKMEVSRNQIPKDDFLKKVREICTKKNIVLIFDECSSGFRQSFGGLHKIYNVNPDIAWFGKTLGNGYPITAIIGRKEIMDCAQDSFISSTFWTERVGPAAAIKTLEVMEKNETWKKVTETGQYIQLQWQKIAKKNNINILISGIPALSTFSIVSNDWLKYKTFLTQEMLKKGYLAGNAFFVSIAHEKKILIKYLENLDQIFYKISKFENKEKNIDEFIDGEICHSGFKRLN